MGQINKLNKEKVKGKKQTKKGKGDEVVGERDIQFANWWIRLFGKKKKVFGGNKIQLRVGRKK